MELNKNIDTLISAIQTHKPIEFEYIQQGKPMGKRLGNPHAIFRDTTKEGVEKVYVHIFQTEGVSEKPEEIPSWREFIVDKMSSVKILEEKPPFSVENGYNPFSVRYSRAICKI
jgi:hypothetical protein